MIVVLMTSRSGSSMVCKMLAEHGLAWKDPTKGPPRQPQHRDRPPYFTYEHPSIKATLKRTTPNGKWPRGDMVRVTNRRLNILKSHLTDDWDDVDFFKAGVEFADLIREFSLMKEAREPKFIKVYRPPEDVADSLANRGLGEWFVGYEVAQKRFSLMEGVDGHTICTPLLAQYQWQMSGAQEAFEACGIQFDEDAAKRSIEDGLFTGGGYGAEGR